MLRTVNDYIDAKLTHSIHTSGAKSFRGCRRRWNWLTNELYYPKTTVKPLEFGVAFHKAMEVLYDPELWTKDEQVVQSLAIITFFKVCDEQFKKYEEAFGTADPEVLADYKERKALGRGMIIHCVRNGRRQDWTKGFKPLLVEVSFEVPIVHPGCEDTAIEDANTRVHSLEAHDTFLYCKCDNCWNRFTRWYEEHVLVGNQVLLQVLYLIRKDWKGLPVTYGGRIDCIMEGPDGRVWIVDWKTAAQLSVDREEFLLLDDQISRYCWALRFLGYRVAGFLYHELRKAVSEEPEPMARPRLGRMFSVNKQQAVEPDIYERTVREFDPVAYNDGLYTEFINILRTESSPFFHRFPIYRNEPELDNVGKNIWHEAKDMIDPGLRIYPNPGRFNCTNCAFRQPCLEENSGGDVFYTLSTLFDKKEYHYWEKEPLSTDRKSG
jgi:hypothetical protein